MFRLTELYLPGVRPEIVVDPSSQSPQFGSRCFVIWAANRPGPAAGISAGSRNPLSSGLGVSSPSGNPRMEGGQKWTVSRSLRELSPRRNPLSSGLGVSSCANDVTQGDARDAIHTSQSPQFGSRCFVVRGKSRSSTSPSRRWTRRNPLSSGLGVSSRNSGLSGSGNTLRFNPGRNPLSSGLGVSSVMKDEKGSLRKYLVAIPSVRVSVFRLAKVPEGTVVAMVQGE